MVDQRTTPAPEAARADPVQPSTNGHSADNGNRRRRALHLQGVVSTVLGLSILVAVALLSERYHFRVDMTATARNSLSPASAELLDRIENPVEITAYARPDPILRRAIAELVERYRAVKPDVRLAYVDPDLAPAEARRLGIEADGELAVHLDGRVEIVRRLGEQHLTGALQRLALRAEHWVTYVTGHGERDLLGGANHDLGAFGKVLGRRGFTVRPLNLAKSAAVPDNATVVVLSQPRVNYLPSEVEALIAYLDRGGSLLWLDDPNVEEPGIDRLGRLRDYLGIRREAGVVVDPSSERPEVAIVSNPGQHALFEGFSLNTLFPLAAAIGTAVDKGWQTTPILFSIDQSWRETTPVTGEVTFDGRTDVRGPLPLGMVLEREHTLADGIAISQRVVVIGDGDFLSNAYRGNGGNLQMGLALINWLSNEDALAEVPVLAAPDLRFEPGFAGHTLINLGPPLALPLLLLGTGFVIWRRRRRR